MSLRSRADSERSEGAGGRRAAVSERCERRRHPAERQRSRYVPWGTAAEQRGGDGIPPSKRKTAEDWQSQILQFERRGRDLRSRKRLCTSPDLREQSTKGRARMALFAYMGTPLQEQAPDGRPHISKNVALSCSVLDALHGAERAGFEPARQFDPPAAFRVRCHRPLGHLSVCKSRQNFHIIQDRGTTIRM